MNAVPDKEAPDERAWQYVPCIPLSGPNRVRWWDSFHAAVELDLLAQRIQLHHAGLSPAAIEQEMGGYRDWLLAEISGRCDGFAAEIIWNHS